MPLDSGIEITDMRVLDLPLSSGGRIVARFDARVGDIRIRRGNIQLTKAGKLEVSTGERGGVFIPTTTALRKKIDAEVLAALEDLIHDRS